MTVKALSPAKVDDLLFIIKYARLKLGLEFIPDGFYIYWNHEGVLHFHIYLECCLMTPSLETQSTSFTPSESI